MKSILSRIVGVGVSAAMLASLLMVAAPSLSASAATLGSSGSPTPSPFGSVLSSGGVVDYAVANDGKTIYAVQGTKNTNSCAPFTTPGVTVEPGVLKSTNGGSTWTTLGTPPTATTPYYIGTALGNGIYSTNTSGGKASIYAVAVAPDDPNTVAILATDYSTGPARTGVYYSTNGGTSWTAYSDLNPVEDFTDNSTAVTLTSVAISPAVGSTRYIAIGGTDNTTSGPGLWYFQTGGFAAHWVDTTHTNTTTGWNNPNDYFTQTMSGNTGTTFAVNFSPNFAGDYTIAVVTGPSAATSANDSVMLQLANVNSKVWNQALYPGWTGGAVVQTFNGAYAVTAASLTLPASYLGASSSSRLAYVSLATNDPDPLNLNTDLGGVYRFTDYIKAQLMADTQAPAGIYSVSVNAGGDQIVAGAYANNNVFGLATPATATAPATWTATGSYKNPSGAATYVNKTIVTYGTGTTVYAGTSDTGVGGQAAFSVSTNGGVDFNDVSLIDFGAPGPTNFTMIEDKYIAPDVSKEYLVTTAAVSPSATSNLGNQFVSLFRWTTGGSWQRVLTLPVNAGDQYIVRVAPDNSDVAYLFNVANGAKQFYYTNDGGVTTWQPKYTILAPTDVAVESSAVLYVLSGNQVSKSIDSGFTWDTAQTGPTTITGLTSGANIQSFGTGNILVGGGSSGGVAYSTNGYTSFTYLGGPASPGTGGILVTADTLAAGGNIYAVETAPGGAVYRWTIGTSMAWTNILDSSLNTTQGIGVIPAASGIALSGGNLYVTTFNNTVGSNGASNLYRALSPSTITSATGQAWSALSNLQDTGLLASFSSYNPNGIPVSWTNSDPTFSGTLVSSIPTAAGARNGLVGTVSGNTTTLWSIGVVPVYSQVICVPVLPVANTYELASFADTLSTVGPTQTTPADKSTIELNLAQGNAIGFPFVWGQLSLSSSYELQIALDSGFTQIVSDTSYAPTNPAQNPVTVVSTALTNMVFSPDTTYYWRVRVNGITVAGTSYSPTNYSAFYSPWSKTLSFKIGPQSPVTLQSPAPGATDVPVQPTFSWTPAQGATTYEIDVSDDPTFAIITFSRTSSVPNFASDEALSYNTVYYWRVRATAPPTAVTPFVNGVFTTEQKPTTPVPPVTVTQQSPPVVTVSLPAPTAAIPSYLLWIIIAIGAILVIALIVLIVRTRRVS